MKTIRLNIKGKVQGVFFRATAKAEANQIGITGIVKNRDDNSVEIIASGSDQNLEQFIAWAKKGSPASIIEKISIEEIPEEFFSSFSILK